MPSNIEVTPSNIPAGQTTTNSPSLDFFDFVEDLLLRHNLLSLTVGDLFNLQPQVMFHLNVSKIS